MVIPCANGAGMAELMGQTVCVSASGRKIYFILTGDGQVGGQAYRRYTTVSCEQEEEAAFAAEAPTEMLVFGLPQLDKPAHYAIAAE